MSAASATIRLRERAEQLAGKMSVRSLTPAESAEAVDIIFDLLRLIDPPGEAL